MHLLCGTEQCPSANTVNYIQRRFAIYDGQHFCVHKHQMVLGYGTI